MISLENALFLSHLPYRRSIYGKGGWPDIRSPENLSNIRKRLCSFFSDDVFYACEKKTAAFLKQYGDGGGYSWKYVRDNDYPVFLGSIYDPPPVIFTAGESLPTLPGIAIVGTRNPAFIVRAAVQQLVASLKEKNSKTAIISGFARGVDSFAHIDAVKNKMHTVCVLGSGIFHPSPKSSLEILNLAHEGNSPLTLVSEFPPDTKPVSYNFPRRNRLIAGLSETLIVMQAPGKSGALISARFALDEGREVYVFDHDLLQPEGMNEGGRRLIYDGAGILELDLNGKIIRRSSISSEGEQLEFFEKKFFGDLSWLGEDYYLRRF